MLTQSDIERERYESRRKFQMDYTTTMNAERREGRVEGIFEEKVKIVHFCERLLGRSITPGEQLNRLSFEDLSKLLDLLQEEVLQRK